MYTQPTDKTARHVPTAILNAYYQTATDQELAAVHTQKTPFPVCLRAACTLFSSVFENPSWRGEKTSHWRAEFKEYTLHSNVTTVLYSPLLRHGQGLIMKKFTWFFIRIGSTSYFCFTVLIMKTKSCGLYLIGLQTRLHVIMYYNCVVHLASLPLKWISYHFEVSHPRCVDQLYYQKKCIKYMVGTQLYIITQISTYN
jgi:hypothetical protein